MKEKVPKIEPKSRTPLEKKVKYAVVQSHANAGLKTSGTSRIVLNKKGRA